MSDLNKIEEAKLDYEDHRKEVFERLKIQASMADAGLRSLMLVNAGAIVGLFTFIGNAKGRLHIVANTLWLAFGFFVGGMVLTLIANIAAFLAQGFYYKATQEQAWNDQAIIFGRERTSPLNALHRWGETWEIVGIGGAVIALACFVIGAALALRSVLLA